MLHQLTPRGLTRHGPSGYNIVMGVYDLNLRHSQVTRGLYIVLARIKGM